MGFFGEVGRVGVTTGEVEGAEEGVEGVAFCGETERFVGVWGEEAGGVEVVGGGVVGVGVEGVLEGDWRGAEFELARLLDELCLFFEEFEMDCCLGGECERGGVW